MRRRRQQRYNQGESGGGGEAWSGYSDLMAGLLMIFILVTALKDHQLNQTAAEPSAFLMKWRAAIESLCQDPDLQEMGLTVDCSTGTIELPDRVFFGFNKEELKEQGKHDLRKVTRTLLGRLREEPVIWERLSIEIRGHADPRATDPTKAYQVNLDKSGGRAREVLKFLTTDGDIPKGDRADLQRIAIASGASHSQRPPSGCRDEFDRTDGCFDRMRRVEIHLRFDDTELREGIIKLIGALTYQPRAHSDEHLG